MNAQVVVSRGEDPYQITRIALQQIPLPDLNGKRVLIKPNAGRVAFPGQGVTTHPSVVEATIDDLREKGATELTIGESCIFGVNAKEAFRVTGMKEVSGRKGIALLDLDSFDPVEIAIAQGRVIQNVRVSSIFRKFDFIVSIPVMKTHMHTQVTLSIKNMKGLLWRREKARLHQLQCEPEITRGQRELDIAISDIASVLFPDLAVIDATVGMEGMGPAYGKVKRMGMIVAGRNPLSTDAVAARLMGLDPAEVPHLRLAAGRKLAAATKGLGEIDPQKLSIKPDDYLKWESPFEPPPSRLSIPFPDVTVHDEGSCSACLSTLLVFVQNYYGRLSHGRLQDGKIHLGIGKHLKLTPKGTILIGNCTSKMKKGGVFIQGCPPVASEIWNTLTQNRKSK